MNPWMRNLLCGGGGGGGGGGFFPGISESDLYLPLMNTLVPTRGASTPTFTRATVAWDFDSEGKLNLNIPSGCPRFTGARFVRNSVATTSATLAVAASNTVTLARSETVTFSMGAGAGTATFSGTSGATGTLTASAGGRTQVTKTCTAGTFIITASVADLVDIQVEAVTGQSDQTASEYVSVGVLSAPFHGAGVDGCKYFTTNKDGSAISPSVLKKYLAEPSRVNNCLWGRDATNAAWTKSNVTAAKTATGLDNVANSASRLTAAANDATLLQLLAATTGTRTTSAWIKRVSGSGTVSLTRNGGTGWTDITSSLVTGTWVPVALTSDVGANPTVGLKMGTSGDVIDVDCFQDENGAWRTSPILTTTAAVTRNADTLDYTTAGVMNGNDITIALTTKLAMSFSETAYNPRWIYSQSDSNNFIRIIHNSGQELCKKVSGTEYPARENTSYVKNTEYKMCGRVSSATGLTFCQGGIFGDTTSANTSPAVIGSVVNIGYGVASGHIGGNIGEVHIWNSALTDAQMQQVTT